MIRKLLIAGIFGLAATLSTSAQVIPFFGHLPMVPFPQAVSQGPPPTSGALLLVNNSSNVLLTNGSNLCLTASSSC